MATQPDHYTHVDSMFHQILKGTVDEVKPYCESSVARQAPQIRQKTKSCNVAYKLINNIKQFTNSGDYLPKVNINVSVGVGNRDRSIRMNLPPDTQRIVSDIRDDTEMSSSDVYALCILKDLYSRHYPIAELSGDPESEQIVKTYNNAMASLIDPMVELNNLLFEYFVFKQDYVTQQCIERNEDEFGWFAKNYKNRFYGTDEYKEMMDMTGDKVLKETESIITDNTGIEFN